MAHSLIPCPSCRRHVRMNEEACRFCGSALPSEVAAVPVPRGRLPRGAVFAFASTLVVSGCGASTEAPVTDSGVSADTGGPADTGGNMALYGAPADTGVSDTGPEDTGGSGALYGAPADVGGD